MTHPLAPANGNLADELSPADLDQMEQDVREACARLLSALRIHPDHNTHDTPARMAKMFVREAFAGRYQQMPKCTDFPNAKHLDEIVVVGPVGVRSTCAHHFCPIHGRAWIGIIPSDRIIGLSKFARITDWIMARPQIQEEATIQLADAIEGAIHPLALGVIVTARHACMSWRGVRDSDSLMTTSVLRGQFKTNPVARAEFLQLVGPVR